MYSKKLHIFVRLASTSWVTSLTILALAFWGIVVNHFCNLTLPLGARVFRPHEAGWIHLRTLSRHEEDVVDHDVLGLRLGLPISINARRPTGQRGGPASRKKHRHMMTGPLSLNPATTSGETHVITRHPSLLRLRGVLSDNDGERNPKNDRLAYQGDSVRPPSNQQLPCRNDAKVRL